MTMRTWGRVVPFRPAADETGTNDIHCSGSEIAGDAEPLEGVFGLVVERAARALRHLGLFELGKDLVDV